MRNGYRFSLIGEEISYSQSPAIFAAIFKHIGAQGQFDLVSVRSNQLQSTLRQLVLEGNRGFSVTMPHKQTIVEYLDDVDPVAQKVCAVNCIALNEQQLLGFNTDCHGFAFPFLSVKRRDVGETALIIGTGGSARAVAHSLYTDFGVRKITVCSRSEVHLRDCCDHLRSNFHKLIVAKLVRSQSGEPMSERFDLVVNCTPLGGFRLPHDSPFGDDIPCTQGGIYYDLNYNRPNLLVGLAKKQGLVAVDGAMMLVAQAVKAFHIWTDIEVPVEPIYEAVFGVQ